MINKDTSVCISLSSRPSNFGTFIHNYVFEELDLNFIYKAFSSDNLAGSIEAIKNLNIRGCGISMPFKEEVISYLDHQDKNVQLSGSCNTLLNHENEIYGFNTDFNALNKLFEQYNIADFKNGLIIGSGGVAKSAAHALLKHIDEIYLFSRNKNSALKLVGETNLIHKNDNFSNVDVIINCTPLGMSSNDDLPCKLSVINGAKIIFDLPICNKANKLKLKAEEKNIQYIPGSKISLIQAHKQFEIYTSEKCDLRIYEKAFKAFKDQSL